MVIDTASGYPRCPTQPIRPAELAYASEPSRAHTEVKESAMAKGNKRPKKEVKKPKQDKKAPKKK